MFVRRLNVIGRHPSEEGSLAPRLRSRIREKYLPLRVICRVRRVGRELSSYDGPLEDGERYSPSLRISMHMSKIESFPRLKVGNGLLI